MHFRAFIHRHRLAGKRVVAWLMHVLPHPLGARVRALAEHVAFNLTPQYQADTLPPIFHYWASGHLAAQAGKVGIDSPEALYLRHVAHAGGGDCRARAQRGHRCGEYGDRTREAG